MQFDIAPWLNLPSVFELFGVEALPPSVLNRELPSTTPEPVSVNEAQLPDSKHVPPADPTEAALATPAQHCSVVVQALVRAELSLPLLRTHRTPILTCLLKTVWSLVIEAVLLLPQK